MMCAAARVHKNGDKVLNTALVLFAALVAKNPSDLADLAERTHAAGAVDFVESLFGLLDYEKDPLWLISAGLNDTELRQAGIAKGDKASVSFISR